MNCHQGELEGSRLYKNLYDDAIKYYKSTVITSRYVFSCFNIVNFIFSRVVLPLFSFCWVCSSICTPIILSFYMQYTLWIQS